MSALILLTPDGAQITPSDARAFTPLADWLTTESAEASVLLAPDDDPFALADHFSKLDAIAVDFPKPTDGRGFSTARLLRERLGWRGELRAVGAVALDQVAFMARCGFDALALREGEDVDACLKALTEISVRYQGDVHDPRPLFRRRAEALAAIEEARS
jgi:uncharacterized protein (DUF934 family)